jgi:hypothetical protein
MQNTRLYLILGLTLILVSAANFIAGRWNNGSAHREEGRISTLAIPKKYDFRRRIVAIKNKE